MVDLVDGCIAEGEAEKATVSIYKTDSLNKILPKSSTFAVAQFSPLVIFTKWLQIQLPIYRERDVAPW